MEGRKEKEKLNEKMKKTERKEEGDRCWLEIGGRKKRSCESPSSDSKAFPMTPPSGQELKPGNRMQRPRRRAYEDGGMAEREILVLVRIRDGEKTRSRVEEKARFVEEIIE